MILHAKSPTFRATKLKGFTVSGLSDQGRMVAMSQGVAGQTNFANVPL